MRVQVIRLSTLTLGIGFVFAQEPKATFETTVTPVLAKNCTACHNDRLASGGLNLGPFGNPASVTSHREEWERILQKIRTGEMPPKGMPRPPAEQMDAIDRNSSTRSGKRPTAMSLPIPAASPLAV